MISAILMLRRLAGALRVALREEDFARILAAGLALIIIGTHAYSVGAGWSVVDGLYVAVATLTTSSVLDPELTVTDPWLKVFTAGYVLVIALRRKRSLVARAEAGSRGRSDLSRRDLTGDDGGVFAHPVQQR